MKYVPMERRNLHTAPKNEHLLNIPGGTRPEPVEGRWFRQAQPTLPRFIEKILLYYEKWLEIFMFCDSCVNTKLDFMTLFATDTISF